MLGPGKLGLHLPQGHQVRGQGALRTDSWGAADVTGVADDRSLIAVTRCWDRRLGVRSRITFAGSAPRILRICKLPQMAGNLRRRSGIALAFTNVKRGSEAESSMDRGSDPTKDPRSRALCARVTLRKSGIPAVLQVGFPLQHAFAEMVASSRVAFLARFRPSTSCVASGGRGPTVLDSHHFLESNAWDTVGCFYAATWRSDRPDSFERQRRVA